MLGYRLRFARGGTMGTRRETAGARRELEDRRLRCSRGRWTAWGERVLK